LQALVNICLHELALIDMNMNCSKPGCLRIIIGNGHSAIVGSISAGNKLVHWLNEIQYLGATILSAKKFTVNLQRTKQKYFRALNAIFG